jgi:pimeloyl-ACP methyl ester carboxylesterase
MNVRTTDDSMAVPSPKVRRGKGVLFWLKRSLLIILVALLLLAGLGLAYQSIATALDLRRFPPPGQMVDVGGYKLHIYCVGEGSPTVILDHIGGGSSVDWALVQPEIAKVTRVCAYDRAGFGWSEAGPAPRDLFQQVREFDLLLTKAGIEGPYLPVGHSYGTRVARLYAAQHPDRVAGIVLIDPGEPYQDLRFPPEYHAAVESEKKLFNQIRPLAPFGIPRLLLVLGIRPLDYGDLPARQQAESATFNRTTKFYQALAGQYNAMPEWDAQEGSVTSLGSIPLLVLSATEPADAERHAWNDYSAELARQSSDGVQEIFEGASHTSFAYQSEYAARTTAAIERVVEAVRSGRPLAQ